MKVEMEKIELSQSRKVKKQKKKHLERLYDKKPLIELIVAILSIPSLILIVLLNYNSLENINGNNKPTPTSSPVEKITVPSANTTVPNFFTAPITRTPRPTQAPYETQQPCNKNLGSASITYPSEGSTVNSNPAEVDISYDNSINCGAVWAYSVNGSSWSDYSNNSVALYNLPNGEVTFQLRVKSIASSDSTLLTRHFTYTGQSTAPVPTTASSSAQ